MIKSHELVAPANNLPDANRVQESWKAHSEILSLRQKIGTSFLELGEKLYEFNDKRLYIEQGCSDFNEYLGSIGLNRSTAYAWKAIYEVFVVKYSISPYRLSHIPWSKLEKIRSKVTEDNLEDMLFKAEELSISDLTKETSASVVIYRTFVICSECGGLISDGNIKVCECSRKEKLAHE